MRYDIVPDHLQGGLRARPLATPGAFFPRGLWFERKIDSLEGLPMGDTVLDSEDIHGPLTEYLVEAQGHKYDTAGGHRSALLRLAVRKAQEIGMAIPLGGLGWDILRWYKILGEGSPRIPEGTVLVLWDWSTTWTPVRG
jgi:hypothetical protein